MDNFYEQISLSAQAQSWLLQNELNDSQYQEWSALLKRNKESFLTTIKETVNAPQRFFAFAVRYAQELYTWYQKCGIPHDVYVQTFRDIAIWEREYRRTHGTSGIAEYEWILNSLTGRVTRLGRLQFELISLPHTIVDGDITLPKGTIVFNVHVPAEEPLSPALVEDSYQSALRFFHGVQPVFLCESWLMNPELQYILPQESNILKFAAPYKIIETEPECKQAQERIFGEWKENPQEYVAQSTLQQAAKQYLLAGNRLGNATGFFIAK